jgi:tetrahydrodipicolinate N-succinyltransferase
VTDSAVGPGAVVGAGAVLVRVTLGDDAEVAAGVTVTAGERIECAARVTA